MEAAGDRLDEQDDPEASMVGGIGNEATEAGDPSREGKSGLRQISHESMLSPTAGSAFGGSSDALPRSIPSHRPSQLPL